MKKRLLGFFLMAGLIAILSTPLAAFADGHKVVALGADLSQEQINMVLRYFGIQGKSIDTIYVTNTDERNHLGGYIPIEQIGTRTISCALVNPTTSGGIQVKTANMNYVTSKMIASTLSTAGVVNCEVLAAAPFEVSGTGALTGVMMAYENAVGTRLDPVKKDVATQELITTEQLADQVGQNAATQIINDIKIQIVENQVKEPEQVVTIVEETVGSSDFPDMSAANYELLQSLAQRIAEQDYDYEEMKETLKRIDEGVTGISSSVDDIAAKLEEEKQQEAQAPAAPASDAQAQTTSEEKSAVEAMAVSIFNATDDNAFGEDTVIDATSEEAMDGYTQVLEDAGVDVQEIVEKEEAASPEPAPAADDSIFGDGGFSWDDSYSGNEETPDVQIQENPADAPADVQIQENPADVPADVQIQENPVDAPVSEDSGDSIFNQDDSFDWNVETPVEDNGTDIPEDINIEVPDENAEAEPAPEENAENVVEEPAAEPLEITDSVLAAASSDETDNASGRVFKFDVNAGNVTAVSGTLTVYDEFGNQVASADLTDGSRVYSCAMSDEDLLNNMWENGEDGTTFYIDAGFEMSPNSTYNVVVSAVLGKADDPSVTADVYKEASISTGDFGVSMDLSSISALKAGNTVSAKLVCDPAIITYAEIVRTDGDHALVNDGKTMFDVAGGDNSFTMTLSSPGTTEVEFYFSYADGSDGSYTFYVNVLE